MFRLDRTPRFSYGNEDRMGPVPAPKLRLRRATVSDGEHFSMVNHRGEGIRGCSTSPKLLVQSARDTEGHS
jgi:hypothetical protein